MRLKDITVNINRCLKGTANKLEATLLMVAGEDL